MQRRGYRALNARRPMNQTRKLIYSGSVVDLGIESAVLPNGRRIDLEVVRHPGGAAVVAIDTQQRVCMLRQYRHAAGGWLWELPAGKRDQGEAPLSTARRELEEEAGVRAAAWHALGSIHTTPGFCDEVIHLFLARDLTAVPTRHEAHEVLECHWIAYEQALAWTRDGTLSDAKSLIGLLRAETALTTNI